MNLSAKHFAPQYNNRQNLCQIYLRFCPFWMKAFFCIEDSEIDDIESIADEDFEDDESIVNDASEDINNLEELEFEDL
jgi:hypothetical protein